MRKGVENKVFFFLPLPSNLSSLCTSNEVLNPAINARSLHAYHSEHHISHSRVDTPVCFTEHLPHA